MLRRWFARRRRTARAATAVAVAVIASLTVAPSQASAATTCPAGWYTQWTGTGVALCYKQVIPGVPSDIAQWLLVVDLTLGAKIPLVSRHVGGTLGSPTAIFHRDHADNWYDWIKSTYSAPAPSKLVAVYNAGFFTTTTDTTTTTLALPERRDNVVQSKGYMLITHNNGWNTTKRKLTLTNPAASGIQSAWVADFPANYTATEAELSSHHTAMVGFNPAGHTDGSSLRNLLGVNSTGTKVYIYQNTLARMQTLADAQAVLTGLGVLQSRIIELDGGQSTQFYHVGAPAAWNIWSRKVPEVLAIYTG